MSSEFIDVEGLRRLSGNDNVFVSEILKLYTERTTSDLKELSQAYYGKDWNTVRFLVHRMRSSAVPLGLKNLVVLLKKVEMGIRDGKAIENVDNHVEEILTIAQLAIDDARVKLAEVTALEL